MLVTYPSYGFQAANGDWRINVDGIAFQTPPLNRRQKMLVRMLTSVMKASDDEIQGEIFQDRIWPFFVEAEKGHSILISIGNQTYRLKRKSQRNGRFNSWFRLSNSLMEQFAEDDGEGRIKLRYALATAGSTAEPIDCEVELLMNQGLSVISDIDDTIKESTVSNRRELLLNTFVREFRSVDGMAAIYRTWRESGADFHYISSSPWQLFGPLQAMQSNSGFPTGTFHLRNFRLRDQFLKKVMLIRRKGKATEIKRLIKNLPARKYILVGDSGEKDPEIYHKICRRFPDQITGLFIREVEGRPLSPDRLAKLQRVSATCQCAVFRNPIELQQLAEQVFDRFCRRLVVADSNSEL